MKTANQLINETSPYLLQHAYNPVNWSAWNEVSWQQAQMENKLVVVSIGYSACHWCHVMEHESFEDGEVAALMNEHFISIKVDREERPDLDQVYMDAVQLISGRGGWPLNAICLPDGRPVYAGTYFPKQNWMQVLMFFVHEQQHNNEKLLERAADITRGIHSMEAFEWQGEQPFSMNDAATAAKNIIDISDTKYGGRAGAPKFPMPVNYEFLLKYNHHTNNQNALEAVRTTLDNMLLGGIYDQVGGGFARYSVDAYWEIPHFEKMLYDNAQLVSLYANAFKATGDAHYKRIVEETLAFIEREMSGEFGNFYAALDADSEGHEGKFYVWKYEDLKKLLKDDFNDFTEIFSITVQGNFEGENHLVRKGKDIGSQGSIDRWMKLLLKERNQRIRPGLDDKSLTAWNAMMLKAYTDAANALNNEHYLNKALQNANFILAHQLQSNGSLLRNFKNGTSSISGFLDDYAFTIEAFIALYETTFDEKWLNTAARLTDYTFTHFYDEKRKLFFYTNKHDAPLIVRKTETSDNVIPASNSVMAKCVYKLSLIFDKRQFTETATAMLSVMKENVLRHSSFYANWALLMIDVVNEPFVVAICGRNATTFLKAFQQHYLPNCIFVGTESASSLPLLADKTTNESTLIYVCRNNTCGLPAESVAAALEQIKAR